MTDHKQELRPCPFCGNDDIRYDGFSLYCKTGGLCKGKLEEIQSDHELMDLEARWNSAECWKLLDEAEKKAKAYRKVAIEYYAEACTCTFDEGTHGTFVDSEAEQILKEMEK